LFKRRHRDHRLGREANAVIEEQGSEQY
jgi:hypothetical protein